MIDSKEIYQKCLIVVQESLKDIMADLKKLEPFTYYLDAVGATGFYTKGEFSHHVGQYERLYSEDIDDILFSCDIVNNETKWTSLWLFNREGGVETKNFPNGNNMRFVRLTNNVDHWNIEQDHYEFFDCETLADCVRKIGTSLSAWLRIVVTLSNGQEIEFTSLGRNCDFLLYIFKKYIKANKIES
jgi:hypothetical protein